MSIIRTVSRITLRCVVAGVVLSAGIQTFAAVGDGHWDRQFAMPGAESGNIAVRIFNNIVYSGGTSIAAGLITSNTPVNIFDGTNWSMIGDLISSSGGFAAVEDVAVYRGELYVGGLFIRANDTPAVGLAKWNGTDWSAVNGFNGAVICMTSDGTNLYVGGTFTNLGGVFATNVAKWDGTNWSDMGGGLGPYSGGASFAVNTLVWQNGLLYAAGSFTNSGSGPLSNLAVWNGSAWASIGGGVNGTVGGIAFLGNDIYVGGQFTTAGGSVSAQNIAKWNGATWSPLGSGVKGASGGKPINDVAVLGSNVYITGNVTNSGGVTTLRAAKWDGVSWSSIGVLNGSGTHITSNAGSLYFSGTFNLAGGVLANHIARFDGANWYPLAGQYTNGTQFFVEALCTGSDGVYAGGFFTAIGSLTNTEIARFDGTSWNALDTGISGAYNNNTIGVRAISPFGTGVVVGGQFANAGGFVANNVAIWNGGWSTLDYGVNNSVFAVAASGSDIYVGGNFTNANYSPFESLVCNNIAKWNSTASWTPLGLGVNGTVSAIAPTASGVYVGGSFTTASTINHSVTVNRIAFWDGDWHALGTGMSSGSVSALFVDGNDLYAGGSFTNASGVIARGIAKWNGSWSALGTGFIGSSTATISAIAKMGANIYAAGLFTNAGGVATRVVARWDGTQWSALGSGAANDESFGVGRAFSMTVDGNNLYVGGVFETAGNYIDAGYLCRWNDQIDFTPPAMLQITKASAAQPGAFTFRANALTAARVTYGIESTTDFQTWSPILTTDVAHLDVTNSTSAPARFFRLKETP